MQKYLTYKEYVQMGGTANQTAFPPLELKARKRIDRLTDSRVQNMREVPEAVKFCAFALIGMESGVGIEAQVTNPVVTSFNTDGYSESYGHALSADEADKAMNRLVGEYLFGEVDDEGVPLLFRGVGWYHAPK